MPHSSIPSEIPRAKRYEPLHLLRQALAASGRYVSPWYLAYLLLGMVTAGMVPVLLPLMMEAVSHHLAVVGYVMGGYNLGLLTSPLWGMLAERRRLYRAIFFGGFLAGGLGIAAMPEISGITAWFPVAFAIGVGAAAATTVASLFIVDFAPQAEWEPRIGWLQSFNGAGQVVGLFIAGAFSNSLFAQGLWMAALLMVSGLLVGGVGLPVARRHSVVHFPSSPHRLLHIDVRGLAAFPRANLLGGGILRHSHYLSFAAVRALPGLAGSAFGRFLLSWFSLSLGVAAFFAFFPLMMRQSYGVDPSFTSIVYAAGAGVGVVLFVLSSRWSLRYGAGRVYLGGLLLRVLGFGLLFVLFFLPVEDKGIVGSVGFVLIVLAWPVLSVSGTELAARLTPMSQGTAMGLFNASGAFATVIGVFAGSPLVHHLGYGVIPFVALLGLAAAGLLALTLRHPETPAPEGG